MDYRHSSELPGTLLEMVVKYVRERTRVCVSCDCHDRTRQARWHEVVLACHSGVLSLAWICSRRAAAVSLPHRRPARWRYILEFWGFVWCDCWLLGLVKDFVLNHPHETIRTQSSSGSRGDLVSGGRMSDTAYGKVYRWSFWEEQLPWRLYYASRSLKLRVASNHETSMNSELVTARWPSLTVDEHGPCPYQHTIVLYAKGACTSFTRLHNS
jgi:hypothetical protein